WAPGKPIKLKTIERFLDELYGSKNYSRVNYKLETSASGANNIVFTIDENPYKAQARMGVNYNDDFGAGLLLAYSHRDLLFKNTRFNLDIVASDMPRAQLNYFMNLGPIPAL
ncbi:hypothetical protein RZS08_31915, partial [Arthrospira platensis SPKY1]|nr:hypothetical protein [Arthrospira platensis SPKY1]